VLVLNGPAAREAEQRAALERAAAAVGMLAASFTAL